MATIAISRLTKRFGPPTAATAAVDSIDLTIESGELFFLLGPSGCGKTTLLRMLAGFIDPTAGAIHFDREDVTHLPPNKRNTGMVFQSYALWPHMTVAENVAYGLDVRKVPATEKKRRVMDALRSAQMHEYAERKPNQLSGGQQQRVALARALVIQPTVLLLDEPLSNLDAKLRLEMRSEIRRICKASGLTAVYVTHDQKEALSMADRMAVLRAGKVVQVGSPRELYDRPRTRFVADFLGETNFIPGVIKGAEDGVVLLDSPAGLLRCRAAGISPTVAGNVTCSVRPEAWRIAPLPPTAQPSAENDSKTNLLTGRLASTTYLGDVAQHTVDLPGGLGVRVVELNPRLRMQQVGSTVLLAADPDDVVILDD
jgi:iron(III) transport system ATP-binding protein